MKPLQHAKETRINVMDTAGRQIELDTPEYSAFYSYGNLVAVKTKDKTYIGRSYDYSITTGKYRSEFLSEGLADTRRKLRDMEYIFIPFLEEKNG